MAARAAVTLAAISRKVTMQHIMVRVPAVANIINILTVMNRSATGEVAIKA